jgi:uncharacterized cupredoxin-like copper-binding protein
MRSHTRPLFAAAILVGAASLPAHSWAATMVNVLLQDSSTDTSIQGMRMTAEPSTIKAGMVTFRVTNASKGLIHEMILLIPPANGKPLPYDARKDAVIESGFHSLGEVSERNPGQSGKLTVHLNPGRYLLICNQAGHYKAGMSTNLTVTP